MKGSPASAHKIAAGDALISINGEPVHDIIDYQYLCAEQRLTLSLLNKSGESYTSVVDKTEEESLGLEFGSGLMSRVNSCNNKCMFCFIDQMPKGTRPTLHFKDDDWRMSFIMGNYITLTNIDDDEFARIIKRRVSPLYISVHSTNGDIRKTLMRNPGAVRIIERLKALYDAKLSFHCQIVCCPGINDGESLRSTLNDLRSLYPFARSVAVVPVGLTKFREGLAPLRSFTQDEARAAVAQISRFAAECKNEFGTSFAFASDEFMLLAGETLPSYDYYENFEQIENGVGLLRLFEYDFMDALCDKSTPKNQTGFDAAGGMAAHKFFVSLYGVLKRYNINYKLHAVRNDYFGGGVTVGGLVTGQDLINQLKGRVENDVLLIPGQMLRENEDVFLDDISVSEAAKQLNVRIIPVRGGGEAWVEAIFDLTGQ